MAEPDRATATARPAPMWGHVAGGLWLLAIAIAVSAVSGFVVRLMSTSLFIELRESTDFSLHEDIFDKLALYYRMSDVADIALGVVSVAALLRIAQVPRSWSRRLALFAAAGFAALVVSDVLFLVDDFTDERSEFFHRMPWLVSLVCLQGLVYAALLTYLTRVASALDRRLPGWLCGGLLIWILWWVGYPIARMIDPVSSFAADHAWLHAILVGSVRLVGFLGFVYALIRVARSAAAPAVDASTAAAHDAQLISSGWKGAADGLKLYGDALAWRLGLALAGYSLLILAVTGKSVGLVKMIAWSLPLAMLLTGVGMIIGLYKFSQQPAPSPGRGPAYAGFVGMLLSAALEAYGFVLIVTVISSDPKSYSAAAAAEKAARQAQSLSVWAMALGFAALVAVLYSFSQVARYVGREQLGSRVTGVSILLISAAVVAVGFRVYVVDPRLSPGALITLSALVAIYALVAVFAYLALARAVERGIRDSIGGSAELPAARVVSDG